MKLSFRHKIAYGSAGIGDAATYSVVGTYLMFFLTTVAHVSPVVAGTIIAIGSVWDVVCSLISGFWSDHCTSRMGRRRPFLFVGATLLAISCSLLFRTIDADSFFQTVYYGLIILMFWTGFGTFFVPYLALGAEFTDDYNERTHLRSYAYGFNMLGMLVGIVLPSVLVDLLRNNGVSIENSWFVTGSFVGIVSAASIYTTFALSKDKDLPRQTGEKEKVRIEVRRLADMVKDFADVLKLKPMKYLLMASIFYLIANTVCGADRLYYFTYNLGLDTASVTAVLLLGSFNGVIFMPIIMTLSRWLDKRALLILMMTVSSVFVISAKFIGIHSIVGMLAYTFVFSIGSAAYWQLMPAILYDICEYDELKTGKRRKGTIVSLQSVAEALSQAIAMQMLGIILQLAGFDGEAAVQTPAAMEWVENSLMIIPAVFMVLTVFMVYLYPITRKKFEEIQEELRSRAN